MSDAVTNVEIEDVLSSIRRLVSEDGRGTADSSEAVVESDEADAKADKLVLTPSLRVASDADEKAEPESSYDQFSAEESAIEEPESDPVELVFEHHGGFENENEDNTGVESVDDVPVYVPQDVSEALSVAVEETVEATVAEIASEALNEEVSDEYSETATYEPPEDEDALESRIAEWEEVVARSAEEDEQWEPEAEELVDAPMASYSEAVGVEEELEEEPAGFRIDESVLDEEALRDLVSEIVRQELQGALGERITRNVRKLVRREIHRALAAQDLE